MSDKQTDKRSLAECRLYYWIRGGRIKLQRHRQGKMRLKQGESFFVMPVPGQRQRQPQQVPVPVPEPSSRPRVSPAVAGAVLGAGGIIATYWWLGLLAL